jgi:hypothetical protein
MAHHFSFQQTGPGDGRILHGNALVAEIRALQLCQVRFHQAGPVIIDATVPIPLYWRQYMNYQDPERNGGYHGKLSIVQQGGDELILECRGENATASIKSRYRVRLTYSVEHASYVFRIEASLSVPLGQRWQVTRNPSHGEIEFCNLWPAHTFVTEASAVKKYQACYVQRGEYVVAIPHHHLESADKNNIQLDRGDRFFWALADANPVFELTSQERVSAGVCAYMWDAHFAYRATEPHQAELLVHGEREFSAQFALYAISRAKAGALVERAEVLLPTELANTPVYLDGLNTFAQSLLDFPNDYTRLWPWSFACPGSLAAENVFALDRKLGCSDHCSLHIHGPSPDQYRWLATSLGPAFGGPPFPERAVYRLSGYVKTESVSGQSTLGIRLHRPGGGNLYDPQEYEHYFSSQQLTGSCEWQKIELTTPVITPAPDRLHLLLQQEGQGDTWFDDIQLETVLDGE